MQFHKYLILLVLLILPQALHAQNPIAIGLLVGVNIASQDFNITSDTNRTTRKGLIITGQTDWPLHKALVLQDRLSYIQKGVVAHRNNLLLGSKDITTALNYIELSLCPKLRIGVYDFQPYMYIGPRVGLLVSGDLETQNGSMLTTEDIRNYYNSWDFGLDMGGGFSYPIIPQQLYFLGDLGFGLGLSNIQKVPNDDIKSAFSRDLKVQIGFMLVVWDVYQ